MESLLIVAQSEKSKIEDEAKLSQSKEAAKLKEVEKQTVEECWAVSSLLLLISPTSKEADAAAESIS